MVTKFLNNYYNAEMVADAVGQGLHRTFVGGMWDEIGRLQFQYIHDKGLLRNMRVVDLGCGCLRGGAHFVEFLDTGNYYGLDISQELLDAGYDIELQQLNLQHKLPRENLLQDWRFDARKFGVLFDVGLAQSVFTHLPLNHLKLCMIQAAGFMKPGGHLYITVFHSPPSHDWAMPMTHTPGGIVSYPDQDPFHYQENDLIHCIDGLPWTLDDVTGWNHPRNQTMVIYRRDAD